MPTIKQKRAYNNAVGNGGNITKAMIAAEYSINTANTPQKLTDSKGWQELCDTRLNDEKLLRLHKKILNKKETVIISDGVKNGSHVEMTQQPHSDAVRALDIAYKVKGRYNDGAYNDNRSINIYLTEEKARRILGSEAISKGE